MTINSVIIDLRNLESEKNTIKKYVFDNSKDAYESPFLPDVIYVYVSDDILNKLKTKNLKISEQHDFIQI